MNVKLAHKHKVDTSYKGALFRANLDSCELYYYTSTVVMSCMHSTQRGAKSYNYPALITWPARPAEPFWHGAILARYLARYIRAV